MERTHTKRSARAPGPGKGEAHQAAKTTQTGKASHYVSKLNETNVQNKLKTKKLES